MGDQELDHEDNEPEIGGSTVKKVGKTNKKLDKWNLTTIEKFLELYEGHPSLWDYKLPEWNVKEDVWLQIAKTMNLKNLNVKEAKDKIRSLRNTYSSELVKISKSKSSGAGLDGVYTPTLRWFPTMDRILGAAVKTRGSQAIGIPDDVDKDKQDELEFQNSNDDVDEQTTPRIKRKTTSAQTLIPPKIRNVPSKKTDERVDKLSNSIRTLQDISEKVLVQPRNVTMAGTNEFNVFGQFVACQLKQLPESFALQAMQHIQTHLFELRTRTNIYQTQHYNIPNPSPTYSCHSMVGISRSTSENSTTTATYHDLDLPPPIGNDTNLLSLAMTGILDADQTE